MNIDVLQIIGGVILGLFVGPLIAMALALLGYTARSKQIEKQEDDLRYEHRQMIVAYKKQYDKTKKKYLKLRDRVVKMIEGQKDVTEDTTAEA